jgi:hypothetical protein
MDTEKHPQVNNINIRFQSCQMIEIILGPLSYLTTLIDDGDWNDSKHL